MMSTVLLMDRTLKGQGDKLQVYSYSGLGRTETDRELLEWGASLLRLGLREQQSRPRS